MTGVKVSHIFSSDLQRAVNTAEAVRSAQSPVPAATTKLEILREQDFGFYEGKQFFERPRHNNKAHLEVHRNNPRFKDVESKQAMAARMDTFVESYLVSLFTNVEEDETVVVVAHGIILSLLWRGVLKKFHRANVYVAPGAIVHDNGRGLEHLGGWSNTGYLDLRVEHHKASSDTSSLSNEPTLESLPPPSIKRKLSERLDLGLPLPGQKLPVLVDVADSSSARRVQEVSDIPPLPCQIPNMSLVVKAVNSTEHLRGLKKTRGGIGSLKHDSTQKTVDSFFVKKQRTG